MTREEIFEKVREVIVDALAVDDDEVTYEATIFGDLEAESIDMLDITFKLEQAFDIKIGEGEMVPQNVAGDPELVSEGKITDKGMEQLRSTMPHLDLEGLEQNPTIESIMQRFNIKTLVDFVEAKVGSA